MVDLIVRSGTVLRIDANFKIPPKYAHFRMEANSTILSDVDLVLHANRVGRRTKVHGEGQRRRFVLTGEHDELGRGRCAQNGGVELGTTATSREASSGVGRRRSLMAVQSRAELAGAQSSETMRGAFRAAAGAVGARASN